MNWQEYFWGSDVSEREMNDREEAYQAFKDRLEDEKERQHD